MSQGPSLLQQWMAINVQPEFLVAFTGLGAEDIGDLQDLEEQDLEKIGMQPLKRRKILRAVAQALSQEAVSVVPQSRGTDDVVATCLILFGILFLCLPT
jgi:hypothetical protein